MIPESLTAKKIEAGFFFGEIKLRIITAEGDDLRINLDAGTAEAAAKSLRRAFNSAIKGQSE